MTNQTTASYHWTIGQAARVFRLDRKTVALRLRLANVSAVGATAGYPVYDAAEIARACFAPQDPDRLNDPNTLPPKERREWYQSENERLKYEQLVGQAIQASEVVREMSALAKIVTTALDSLPDILERELGLTGADIERIQNLTDGVRVSIYEQITNRTDGE